MFGGVVQAQCRLCGRAVVELEHAAESLAASYRACFCQRQRGCGRDEVAAQTLVRPFLMIVMDERPYRRSEAGFAEWHDSIQALRFNGQDKPLGKGVQIGTPRWQ